MVTINQKTANATLQSCKDFVTAENNSLLAMDSFLSSIHMADDSQA